MWGGEAGDVVSGEREDVSGGETFLERDDVSGGDTGDDVSGDVSGGDTGDDVSGERGGRWRESRCQEEKEERTCGERDC